MILITLKAQKLVDTLLPVICEYRLVRKKSISFKLFSEFTAILFYHAKAEQHLDTLLPVISD